MTNANTMYSLIKDEPDIDWGDDLDWVKFTLLCEESDEGKDYLKLAKKGVLCHGYAVRGNLYYANWGFLLLLSRLNSPSKVTRYFSSGFLCSFLCPPEAHERKERSANLPTALLCLLFLNGYPSRPYIGVRGESPIDFLIGKGAVNVSTHYHSAILNYLLPCFFSALGKHLKNSLENVLRSYSVNFLLHILKIQQLVICVPSARHSITCGG